MTSSTLHPLGLGDLGPSSAEEPGRKTWIGGAIYDGERLLNGYVVLEGPDVTTIEPADASPPEGARVVETNGLIVPGFVDIHNHLPFAVFPSWRPSRPLEGRFDWRGKTRCGVVVNPFPEAGYRERVSSLFRALDPEYRPEMVRYGLVRAAIGGATAVVVDADLAESDFLDPRLAVDVRRPATKLFGLLDVGCLDGKALDDLRAKLKADEARLLVHVAEGFDEFSKREFTCLKANGLLTRNTVLIHGLGLSRENWAEVREAGAKAVWSPASHQALYGRTLDGAILREFTDLFALAPDWTITGSSTFLEEFAAARRSSSLPARTLLDMATRLPAAHIGDAKRGWIGPRSAADLVVLDVPRVANAEAAALAATRARIGDVALVVSAGVGIYGRKSLMAAWGPEAEPIQVPSLASGEPRALRLAGESFGAGCIALEKVLKAARPGASLAPLWEEPASRPLDHTVQGRDVSEEDYRELAEYERHLNNIQHEYRKTALLWVAAIVAGTGYLLKPSSGEAWAEPWYLVTALGLVGAVGLFSMWFLDQRLYHQLLRACVKVGEELEAGNLKLPPLHLRMRHFLGNARAPVAVAYILAVTACAGLSCVGLVMAPMTKAPVLVCAKPDPQPGTPWVWLTSLGVLWVGLVIMIASRAACPDQRLKELLPCALSKLRRLWRGGG